MGVERGVDEAFGVVLADAEERPPGEAPQAVLAELVLAFRIGSGAIEADVALEAVDRPLLVDQPEYELLPELLLVVEARLAKLALDAAEAKDAVLIGLSAAKEF